ncbi:DNA gyrase inhibitor YacG [Bacteriovorax stolpii]|uniref:DNA gyrase inhibitor YacG n=1 Tax=Bacteriovorax stolpii TaxID=960 RepID=A0A2K9NNL7_BACTC|nr:DNA gyrase inhibitor YacG [Bacteriovorax stolpii]AUN97093.1 DNA gyrase inhibitor YacG [Bacteriovorax stolpii]QDK42972.1 DNA gyrase inhibitor YacG [Bacteriovorax stolpii]TDP53379.1 hypothetical protein C8D79_2022 [Bacteriovorax stolpii]
MNKLLKVKCPQCDTTFTYYESEFRPFCSKRCQQIDLGHWFQETYTVPTRDVVMEEEQSIDQDSDERNESEYES